MGQSGQLPVNQHLAPSTPENCFSDVEKKCRKFAAMKLKTNYIIFLMALPVLLLSEPADHLIFKRIALSPKEAEMVVIHNPTDQDVNLSNYYLTDATKPADGKYYYNLPTGEDYWSNSISDFIARFPDTTLAAGGDLVLGLHNRSYYEDYYDASPDLVLFGDMLDAEEGEQTISISDNFYTVEMLQSPEVLILFYWDGSSSLVKDVDYFLWGNTSYGVSKPASLGYLPDTPVDEQYFMPAIGEHMIYFRTSLGEIDEFAASGNGITGHDETSENFEAGWNVVFNTSQLTPLSQIIDGDFAAGAQLIVQGMVVEFADVRPNGGPQIITIEDDDGYRLSLTVWDWDVASSSIGSMVDPYDPSIYIIQAKGILDYYLNWQLEIASVDDIVEYSVLHPDGDFVADENIMQAKIEPAPYVIIPSIGERLDFSYSFPSNSRVVVRIFDISGRFITSLVDRYYEQAGTVYRMQDYADWNGRDHLGQLVPPGTYFMHIETNNFTTGSSSNDVAPVVVGVKF